MNGFTDWFKTKDYDTGVELYSQLPNNDVRLLKSLQRGKSDRNMAILIRALRRNKNSLATKAPDTVKPASVNPKPKAPSSTPTRTPKPPVAKTEQHFEKREAVEKSAGKYFKRIRYGELPSPLKIRFRELKNIFYDMCDLKFELNELPASAEEKALAVQLQIESLSEQRDRIWKELDHWQEYKTMLPSDATEDFSQLTPQQLFLKKANLASSISKIKKRIQEREQRISKEPDKELCQRLTEQNNRSLKKLHQHEINLGKIQELLE